MLTVPPPPAIRIPVPLIRPLPLASALALLACGGQAMTSAPVVDAGAPVAHDAAPVESPPSDAGPMVPCPLAGPAQGGSCEQAGQVCSVANHPPIECNYGAMNRCTCSGGIWQCMGVDVTPCTDVCPAPGDIVPNAACDVAPTVSCTPPDDAGEPCTCYGDWLCPFSLGP